MVAKQPTKKIAPRMRRFVKNMASGQFKTMTAAGVAAGYAPSTIHNKGRTMLNRTLVKSELTEALERQGVTYDDIVRPLVDGLKATRSFVNPKAGTLERTQIPDHNIRLETHDRAVALFGGIPKVGEAAPTAHGLNLFIAIDHGDGRSVDMPPKMIGPRATPQETLQQHLRLAVQVKESGPHNQQALKPDPALND